MAILETVQIHNLFMPAFTTKLFLYLSALMMFLFTTITCSSQSSPTPSLTPVPTAKEILNQTSRTMEQIDSLHFKLHHETGFLELTPGLMINEVEGDLSKPDLLDISFNGSFGGIALNTQFITVGNSAFMTNPLTGKWERGPTGVSSLGFFDPKLGIGAIISRTDLANFSVPKEQFSEQESIYVISGVLPTEALLSIVGQTLKNLTVSTELVIDSESFYLLEVTIKGKVVPNDRDDVVRIITLSDFDKPVLIEPPL